LSVAMADRKGCYTGDSTSPVVPEVSCESSLRSRRSQTGVLLCSGYPTETQCTDEERINLASGSGRPGLGVGPFASSNSPSRRPPQVPGGARSRQGITSPAQDRRLASRRIVGDRHLAIRARSGQSAGPPTGSGTVDLVRLRPTAWPVGPRRRASAPSRGRVPLATYFVPTMQRAMPGTRTLPSFSNTLTFAMTFARIRSRAGSSTC
jgi:hypothetical protein